MMGPDANTGLNSAITALAEPPLWLLIGHKTHSNHMTFDTPGECAQAKICRIFKTVISIESLDVLSV